MRPWSGMVAHSDCILSPVCPELHKDIRGVSMSTWKEPADVAATEDLGAGPAFPPTGTIDGVALVAGNRVLVS